MAEPAHLEPIRERVKTIIRRDLKLGEVAIADDMPFFSSETDLDSLDMLLLVTSVEREFGIKIPSQEVGRSAFQSVDTLTRYIHERTSGAAADATPAPATPVDPLSRLPHADPFRFVTRLANLTPGLEAEGVWSVSGNEAFFAGHFPGQPIVPGVLLAEALAQVSGLTLVEEPVAPGSGPLQGKLVHVDVRFERPVTPPVEVVLRSRHVRRIGPLQQFDVSAEVNGTVVARGSLSLHVSAAASPAPDQPKGAP